MDDKETNFFENEESQKDNEETLPTVEGSDQVIESDLVVLQRIDDTLSHIDSVTEYGVSLFIIFMLVLVLNYIYKFFKLFI